MIPVQLETARARFLSRPVFTLSKPLILLCFFVSGACGLMYEVAWLRVLGLIFGNTTFATSAVLSSYMAGLGLGALFFGRWIEKRKDALFAYGILEGGVAIYAFLTPLFWKLIDLLNLGFYQAFQPSFFAGGIFKFIVAFLFLILPTFLMGGTLPILSKYFVRSRQDTAKSVGLLYALNTLGAVIGVLATGFFLLYALGVWQTVYLTAVINVVIFLMCLTGRPGSFGEVADNNPEKTGTEEHLSQPPMEPLKLKLLLILFAFSGAVSMLYEIAWTRAIALSVGGSVYAFSIMLATFLLGISLGSYLFSLAARKIKTGTGSFALLQVLTATFGMLGINQFDRMPFYFIKLHSWASGSVVLIEIGKFALCALVMLPPTLCIGAMFSCFIHMIQRSSSVEKEVGRAYFANTIGTILGSALTGFLIIPLIGVEKTLFLAASVNAVIAVAVVLITIRSWSWMRSVAIVMSALLFSWSAFAVEPWDISVLASGAYMKPDIKNLESVSDLARKYDNREHLYYKEGMSSTVSVIRVGDDLSLTVNGKPDASTRDAFTQYFLGHLPMLHVPGAKKAMVIGLGSGSTAAAIASYPVEQIDVVELEPAVVEAAAYFTGLNRNVLNDPRVSIYVNDGRNFVLTHPETYDVIVSEPSNPWIAGVANLFSREHYLAMARKLNSGGVVCQWVHAYSMSKEDLRMILKTFAGAFPHVSLWMSNFPDLMILGSNDLLSVDMNYVRASFLNPDVYGDFKPFGIEEAEGLFSAFILGDEKVRKVSETARTNQDNRPYLEFSAPRNLYRDTLKENFHFINSFREDIFPRDLTVKPALQESGKLYNALARAFFERNMERESMMAIARSGAIDADNTDYLATLGMLQFRSGETDLALPNLSMAVTDENAPADAFYYLGAALSMKEMPEQASSFMVDALKRKPEEILYLRGLADLFYRQKQYGGALKLYDQILKQKDGRDIRALTRVAEIVSRIGELPQKIAVFNRIVQQYPRKRQAYEMLGRLYEAAGDPEKAAGVYEAQAETFPLMPDGYLNLARLYDTLGDKKRSQDMIMNAVKVNPELKNNPELSRAMS